MSEWEEIEAFVERRQPKAYGELRLERLRTRHESKATFVKRLGEVRLVGPPAQPIPTASPFVKGKAPSDG